MLTQARNIPRLVWQLSNLGHHACVLLRDVNELIEAHAIPFAKVEHLIGELPTSEKDFYYSKHK